MLRGYIRRLQRKQYLQGGESKDFFWGFGSREIEEWLAAEWRDETASAAFSVSFELPEKREVKERLIFDSGLYLGLGVSLILSGIYEALKIRAGRKE